MKEKGKIVEKKGEVVVIEIEKGRKECFRCGLCKMGGKPYIEIESEGNLNIGDEVIVEISEDIVFKSTLLIYGLPLAGFITGILLGGLFKNQIGKVMVFFLIFGISWYFGFSLANKLSKRYKPQVKILSSQNRQE